MSVLFSTLLFLGVSQVSFAKTFPTVSSSGGSNYVSHCTIFDRQRQPVWNFPAQNCLFFNDGSFLAAEANKLLLTYYNREGKVIWSRAKGVHHNAMSVIEGGKSLVFLSDGQGFDQRRRCRTDLILKLDAEGNTVGNFEISPKFDLRTAMHFDENIYPAKCELSHANSIYEIPKNRSKIPAFRKGNLIINDTGAKQIFILPSNLKKVLWKFSYAKVGFVNAHDVQVLPSGELLVYVNKSDKGRCSSIVILDPMKSEIVWSYSEKDKSKFCSEFMGGVQSLGDRGYLYSNNLTENQEKISIAVEISKDGKEKWRQPIESFRGAYVQAIYERDLSAFLKNNLSH